MASTKDIRHFILGLLTQQPMSGYGIKRSLKSLSWLIDSPSFGSIYPALRTLQEDGLVTVEVAPGPGSREEGVRQFKAKWRGTLVETPTYGYLSPALRLWRAVVGSVRG